MKVSITEKLHQAYHNDLTDVPLLLDAADEIERLQAALTVTDEMVERAIDAWNDAASYSTINLKLHHVLTAVLEGKP